MFVKYNTDLFVDIADNSYYLYPEDIQLMRKVGFTVGSFKYHEYTTCLCQKHVCACVCANYFYLILPANTPPLKRVDNFSFRKEEDTKRGYHLLYLLVMFLIYLSS